MKNLATILGAVAWLLSSTPAQAQEKFQYSGTQIQSVLSADLPVHKVVKLTAQGVYLTVPDSNVHFGFAYFGVQVQPLKWLWVAYKFGVAPNWQGQWPFITSWALGVDIYKQYLTVFAMLDLYLNRDVLDLYGYYSVDSQFLKWMSAGVHAEHVNKDVTFGAHVMFNYKFLSFGLEHHIGEQEAVKGHSLRLVMKMHFSGS